VKILCIAVTEERCVRKSLVLLRVLVDAGPVSVSRTSEPYVFNNAASKVRAMQTGKEISSTSTKAAERYHADEQESSVQAGPCSIGEESSVDRRAMKGGTRPPRCLQRRQRADSGALSVTQDAEQRRPRKRKRRGRSSARWYCNSTEIQIVDPSTLTQGTPAPASSGCSGTI